MVRAFSQSTQREPSWGAGLLRELPQEPAEVRERIYSAWSAASQNGDGVIGLSTLWLLPTDLAEREARRHLVHVTPLTTRREQRSV